MGVLFCSWCKEETSNYCSVAKDMSASAIQTIGRQHSGSSLQQILRAGGAAAALRDQGASSASSAPAALTLFQWEMPGHSPAA